MNFVFVEPHYKSAKKWATANEVIGILVLGSSFTYMINHHKHTPSEQ